MRISKGWVAAVAVLAACMSRQMRAAGPEETTAKVTVTAANHQPLALKRPEQVAFMFMAAIADLEDDCDHHLRHYCSMEELVNGVKSTSGWPMSRLKFDPRTTDPNYTYVLTAGEQQWMAKAIPKRPGLGGFYSGDGIGELEGNRYNPKGEASAESMEIDSYSIGGDSFKSR